MSRDKAGARVAGEVCGTGGFAVHLRAGLSSSVKSGSAPKLAFLLKLPPSLKL